MAHDIYGDRMFAERGDRKLAWHGICDFLIQPGEFVTVKDAMIRLGMLYKFEKTPIYFRDPITNELRIVPDKMAILREPTSVSPDWDAVSVVNADYGLVQHGQIADALDRQPDINTPAISTRFPLETLGALGNGEQMFLTLKGGDSYQIQGDPSEIERYFLLTESKKGNGALIMMPTDVRVVCANTLSMALNSKKSAGQQIKIVHNKEAVNILDLYTTLISKALEGQQTLKEALEALATFHINKSQAEEIIRKAYPDQVTTTKKEMGKLAKGMNLREMGVGDIIDFDAVDSRQMTIRMRAMRMRDEVWLRYEHYNDEEIPALAGTAYNLIQAISEVSDNRIGKGNEKVTAVDVIQGHRADERNNAMEKALELMGAAAN